MLFQELNQNLQNILSPKEIEVVAKRLQNKSITPIESNYLSRSIRPKLRSAEFAASQNILSLLDYRRKKYEREDKLLKNKIIASSNNSIKNIKAIILFGSYVRNSHANYRDIDIMIVLNKKSWKNSIEKNKLEKQIENTLEINLDINLVVYKELIDLFVYSPVLQNELEHRKVIYGKIKLKKKIIINKKYLYKRILEVESVIELGKKVKSQYIYNAIRTCVSINLFLKTIVNNDLTIKNIEENIGKITVESLIENRANIFQKDMALRYLKHLYKKLEGELK